MRRMALITGLILLALLAACGGQTADTMTMEPAATAGELVVDNVSANLSLPTATGAVYMRITNGSDQDDALLGATVPGCGVIELHEMSMDGDVMRMRPVEGGRIEVPAGATVMLERGGLHVMCIDKTTEYAVGDTVPVTLEFEQAGTIEVSAMVVEPGEMNMDDMGHGDMEMGGEGE